MKKKFSLFGCIISIALILFSCDKNFDRLNENPNSPTTDKVDIQYVLSEVMAKIQMDVNIHQRIVSLNWDLYAEYYANEGFSTQYYTPVDSWSQQYWSSDYQANWVKNLNEVISYEKEKHGNNSNILQIARILKVLVFQWFTDTYGNVPYFNMADGSGTVAAYDSQKDIYADMLSELRSADSLLSINNSYTMDANQDLIYGGDVAKWKRFANSLRLRLAMRMSEVDPATAKTEAESAVTDGVFTDSTDNFLSYSTTADGSDYGNMRNGYYYYYSWNELAMSRSFENLMVGLGGIPFPTVYDGNGNVVSLKYDDAGIELSNKAENTIDPEANLIRTGVPSIVDPRGPVYFNVTTLGSNAGSAVTIEGKTYNMLYRWVGIPSGLSATNKDLVQYNKTDYPRMGSKYTEETRRYVKMGYTEVLFLLAEGALKGWNMGGTAQSFYEKGIKYSMATNGVDQSTAEKYLSSNSQNVYGTTVNYNYNSGKSFLGKEVDSYLAKIITQKYLALFPDGALEAWCDHRRLGYPVFIPLAAPSSGTVAATDGSAGNYIKRLTYPTNEATNNATNYNAALNAMGGSDKVTYNMWWDKN